MGMFDPVRHVKAALIVYRDVKEEDGTVVRQFIGSHQWQDDLIEISIERTGEDGKFFGFGICQRIVAKIIDKERTARVQAKDMIKVEYQFDDTKSTFFHPEFKVTQVRRDEKTNQLTIYGYDLIFDLAKYTVADLDLKAPYTLKQFATACAAKLGKSNILVIGDETLNLVFNRNWPYGANFEGTENLREAMNDVAEASQTIYFFDGDFFVFKRLEKNPTKGFQIDKTAQFELESGDNRRLSTIMSVTELGDNVSASTTESGSTQYVRDNAFWEQRDDIAELLNDAIAAVGGLTIAQIECDYRGALIDLGTALFIEDKEGKKLVSYLLSDTLTYNGGLKGHLSWKWVNNDAETAANPTSLGETLKQTYAKVDKVNKNIELVAGDIDSIGERVGALEVNTNSITASVQDIQKTSQESLSDMNKTIQEIIKKTDVQVTPEDVIIQIQKQISDGNVTSVKTTTGFTFDEVGLTVNKTGSEMKTQITEDGMTVYRGTDDVLTADSDGVFAKNLRATTYLTIGTYSRFEDYDSRTGCFWIGP